MLFDHERRVQTCNAVVRRALIKRWIAPLASSNCSSLCSCAVVSRSSRVEQEENQNDQFENFRNLGVVEILQ